MRKKKSRIYRILIIALAVSAAMAALSLGWLWFDTNVDRSGWTEKDGIYSYRDFHGKKITGWLEQDGGKYYFDGDCAMVVGWLENGGSRYRFGSDGRMITGWREIDGERYYFRDDGAMATGWLGDGGERYFLESDGTPATGWQTLEGERYYFGGDGAMTTGWLEADGETYYFSPEGTMQTGQVSIDGTDYYFLDGGQRLCGWVDLDQGRYYYLEDGGWATGWQELNDRLFLFGDDGVMETGWYQDGEYRYYLRQDEGAAVGPVTVDGEELFFTPDGIQVTLVNSDHPLPENYTLTLAALEGDFKIAEACLEPMERMLADCLAAGYKYTINNTYRSYAEQQDILDTRIQRYMEEDEELTYEKARKKALDGVALPGTSEHQLGLSADINGVKGNNNVPWLIEHCWEYGFILRFPEGKSEITGIEYEPWHFRYVGTRVSLPMKDSGMCLEEYLGAA